MAKHNKAPKKVTRVLIVDDHPAVREGLTVRINREADLQVCGVAADLAEALRFVEDSPPDVAIIDVALKNSNGIDLIKRIKAHSPSVRMLVWSMYDESLYAERALHAGALGYINKEQATDNIIDAIRQVLQDKVYLSGTLSERLLHRNVGQQESPIEHNLMESLSDRELQVFRLFGKGLSTKQIGESMHVSRKTVETYRGRIKEKLNISSNELIRMAVQWVIENG